MMVVMVVIRAVGRVGAVLIGAVLIVVVRRSGTIGHKGLYCRQGCSQRTDRRRGGRKGAIIAPTGVDICGTSCASDRGGPVGRRGHRARGLMIGDYSWSYSRSTSHGGRWMAVGRQPDRVI